MDPERVKQIEAMKEDTVPIDDDEIQSQKDGNQDDGNHEESKDEEESS